MFPYLIEYILTNKTKRSIAAFLIRRTDLILHLIFMNSMQRKEFLSYGKNCKLHNRPY